MSNLERFIYIQNRTHDIVLSEIRNGKKISHWMWYTFPQIKGLGQSDMAIFYSIENLDEARRYLENKMLNDKLKKLSRELLNLETNDPVDIFGTIDSMKLKSSMTLFDYVEEKSVFKDVLDKYYQGQKDELTIQLLERKR